MAAQDAELKLKVSLDLGFFRQQLAGLGQAAAGYSMPVQVKFDRRSIQNELNALGANIRRRNYTLNVNTNLAAEIENAKTLAKELENLSRVKSTAQAAIRQQMGAGALSPGPKEGGVGVGDVRKLYKAAANAGILEFNKEVIKRKGSMIAALDQVGQDAIAGLLNGLNSQDARLKAAAASLGEALISTLKAVLGIASPSKETAKLGKFAAEGLGKGFASGMVQVERQMANAIRSAVMGAIKEGLGKLPGLGSSLVAFERQLAAGVQSSVRKAMREGLSTSVVPGIKGGAVGALGGAATGAAVGGSKALTGATAAGLAKLGAGGMIGVAGQMGRLAVGDTSGLTAFIQEAVSQTIHAALSSGGQGALVGAAAVGGVAGLAGFASGTINSLTSQVATAVGNRVLAALLTVSGSDVKGIVQVAVRDITNVLFGKILNQVRASMAGLPAIDWQATIPPSKSVGTTMALAPGATPEMLPGTAFGRQKFLPTDLSAELKRILRDAAFAFVDSLKQQVRTVAVGLAANGQPLLPSGRVAGLLPPSVGRTPNVYATGAVRDETQQELFARRTAEAYSRSAQRAMESMGGGGPFLPPGRPPGGGGGGGFGMGGLGGFGRAMNGINLPGSGTIRELGDEFGFAAKQVLLFGTAYKALAFLQNFPAQVGAAVGQLQSFRNTLGAISPTAQEAAASNRLILDLVEKYNVPLQSARDGFTKLYASMAPAGFSGDEIRNLFTGITQAAATFGMSADKVDRVNYAFAQMASKGQVMSEELKGQLGDVLPGAMALFAKAAGFEGPKAIQDFSAALEDGRYKGEAMVALLKNVGVVMKQEFGPGAEGAALTFQGVINRMQNSMTLLYESFEPVAVGFLNTVVVPLTDGIKTISDGFTSFFTGVAAKTSGGFGIAQELERLKPAFDGIGNNIKAVIEQLGQFARVGLEVGKVLLQIAGNPFVGYLGRVYLSVLALTTAIQILNLRALIPMIANFARSAYALIAFTAQCVRAGQAVQITGLMLRTFFATTGVGIVLVGIGLLIEKFMSMNQALSDTRAKALGAADAIRSMSQTEARAAEQSAQSAYKTIGAIAGRSGSKISGPGNDRIIEISERELKQLQGVGALQTAKDPLTGRITARRSDILSLAPQAQRLQAQAAGQIRDLRFQEQQANTMGALAPIPAGGGEEKGNEKALRDAEQAAKQEQQRRIELAGLQNDMDKINFDYRMNLSDSQFEHEKRMIDELNNYELSGLNDIQARQVKFAQDLKKIQLNAIDAVRKARQKMDEAQFNVMTAQRTAQAAGVSGAASGGPVIGGFTPTQLSNATAAASKFTGIANMCSESVKAFYKSLGISLPGVTAWADTVRNAGTTMKDWSKLAPGDIVATGKPGDTPHVGVYTGGQNVFHQSRSRGLKAGNYPDLDYFKQGGYFVRPDAATKQSSASFSMETKTQKESFDLVKEQAKASSQVALQQIEIQNALKIAYVETASVIKANIDNIFPVEKQKLDLRLQQMRHNLLMQGMPQEYIDYEEKRAAAIEEGSMATKVMKDNLQAAKAELRVYNDAVANGTKLSVEQQANVTRLTGQIAALEDGLTGAAERQREYNIASLEGVIATMKQADALKAMEEVSGRINEAVEGVTGTYKSLFKEIAMGEDSVEALKKAQQALADQFLTMFFDFAMKPVEDTMKGALGKMFGVPNEEEKRKESIKKMEEQLAQLKLIENNTAITAGKATASGAVPTPPASGQTMAPGSPALQTLPFNGQTGGMLQTLPFNGQTGGMLQNLPFPAGDTGFLSSIGLDTEAITSEMTNYSDVFKSNAETFDIAASSFASSAGDAAEKLGPNGDAGKKWQESLGKVVGGLGLAAGSVMGIVAGINQVKEGGTSNVLGGIGMIASMAGSLLGGFSGLFGGGAGASSIVQGKDIPIAQMPAGMQFANGGIAFGGFRAFANGGVVSGPTLGLVGEGKYNEAIVPLPDGRSIPVQLGGRTARDLMGGGSASSSQGMSLNMNFETTKINGVEYVSREQLEAAMAETRRASIAGGAKQGMSMTLDKLRQSPSTRSRVGMR